MRMQPGQGLWGPAWTIELPSLPGLKVGVDAQGQIRVPYGVARSAMVSVSAVDVLRGKVEPGLLNGAWVVVGASAFGLADVVPTALGGAVSGAEVHLQLLVGLLDAAVPFTPRAAPWLQGIYGASRAWHAGASRGHLCSAVSACCCCRWQPPALR